MKEEVVEKVVKRKGLVIEVMMMIEGRETEIAEIAEIVEEVEMTEKAGESLEKAKT